MRANVYTDKALSSRAGQFVWLSVDTEKAVNAAVLEKYPVTVWPSMFVIDPVRERVLVRWVGSATVQQLFSLLDSGRVAAASAATAPTDRRSRDLVFADSLYGAGDYPAAATAYGNILNGAPADWPELSRTVDAYLFALLFSDQHKKCAETARERYRAAAGTGSAATVAAVGLDCALEIPKEEPGRAALVDELEKASLAVLADEKLQIASDDRSGVYQSLVSARDDAGDEAGKKKRLDEWIAFLERVAGEAKTAEERAVYDSHRVSAYLEAGQPARALPMLEASERDLPQDYNPPARLALIYKEMKQYDKALQASDRALARSYGPRRMGILRTRADIYEAQGDVAAAKRTLQQAIDEGKALPPAQRPSARALASLQARIDKLSAPPAPPAPGGG